jgi:hypothetical protein
MANINESTGSHGHPPESKLIYDPVAAAKGWQAARDAFALQDEKMIKRYQEEIDSILIFVCEYLDL